MAADHVYVRSHDMLGVEKAHYAGYHTTPVAALGDYAHLVLGFVVVEGQGTHHIYRNQV